MVLSSLRRRSNSFKVFLRVTFCFLLIRALRLFLRSSFLADCVFGMYLKIQEKGVDVKLCLWYGPNGPRVTLSPRGDKSFLRGLYRGRIHDGIEAEYEQEGSRRSQGIGRPEASGASLADAFRDDLPGRRARDGAFFIPAAAAGAQGQWLLRGPRNGWHRNPRLTRRLHATWDLLRRTALRQVLLVLCAILVGNDL